MHRKSVAHDGIPITWLESTAVVSSTDGLVQRMVHIQHMTNFVGNNAYVQCIADGVRTSRYCPGFVSAKDAFCISVRVIVTKLAGGVAATYRIQ